MSKQEIFRRVPVRTEAEEMARAARLVEAMKKVPEEKRAVVVTEASVAALRATILREGCQRNRRERFRD